MEATKQLLNDLESKPCPKCKSTHFITTATQTICVPCGRRVANIEELAADFAEGEAVENLEVA